ncbi:peptidoglycan DD-metalloendopeptidase family protein [Laceyella putida]|uniref:Peptidoglycan DD-metalloendopeptidase family protein n=1 Tax=Laceyella putida TaxID=110101 RepID=A0ABW2RMN7_9BACL
MKKASLFIAMVSLSGLIVFLPPSNKAWLQMMGNLVEADLVTTLPPSPTDGGPGRDVKQEKPAVVMPEPKPTTDQPVEDQQQGIALKVKQKNGHAYIQLDEIKQHLPIKGQVDFTSGKISLKYQDLQIELVRDNPVMNLNGIYAPLEAAPLMQDSVAWIPVSILQEVFKQSLKIERNQVVWIADEADVPAFAQKPTLPEYSARDMIEYLSFLETPIKGAHVSTKASHLPGAPRTYRNGVHEGLDWYSYGTGVLIDKKTPIHSIADGVVVRADHGYREMTTPEREALLAKGSDNDGQTPEYILDRMRGRSVWIQYDKGILARYVHLDRIPDHVKVGQKIKAGEIIGYVGNSGTSDGAKGNDNGLHLHLDLLLYGDWFWNRYSPEERRMILEGVFNQ